MSANMVRRKWRKTKTYQNKQNLLKYEVMTTPILEMLLRYSSICTGSFAQALCNVIALLSLSNE